MLTVVPSSSWRASSKLPTPNQVSFCCGQVEVPVSYTHTELVFSSGLYCQIGIHTPTGCRPELCRKLRLATPFTPTDRELLTTKAVEMAEGPDGRSAHIPTPVSHQSAASMWP